MVRREHDGEGRGGRMGLGANGCGDAPGSRFQEIVLQGVNLDAEGEAVEDERTL